MGILGGIGGLVIGVAGAKILGHSELTHQGFAMRSTVVVPAATLTVLGEPMGAKIFGDTGHTS